MSKECGKILSISCNLLVHCNIHISVQPYNYRLPIITSIPILSASDGKSFQSAFNMKRHVYDVGVKKVYDVCVALRTSRDEHSYQRRYSTPARSMANPSNRRRPCTCIGYIILKFYCIIVICATAVSKGRIIQARVLTFRSKVLHLQYLQICAVSHQFEQKKFSYLYDLCRIHSGILTEEALRKLHKTVHT